MDKFQLNAIKNIPLISVVLPAYNAEKYIREAILSILSQSFTNFELIVINDGSTDRTQIILEKIQKQDSRIILISRKNKGLVLSLNEGIDQARGRWIARMDADDIALPDRFYRQLQWLEETGADIIGSWAKCFGSDERIIERSQSDAAIKMELLFNSPFVHPTVMMKTVLARSLRYRIAWEKCEDYDFWERAARANLRMANVPEVLLLYRVHESQISTESSLLQLQRAQKVRLRYWKFISGILNLNHAAIDEVIALREPVYRKVNMDKVDTLFENLLEQTSDESREVIFERITRLYFKAAVRCLDVAIRWGRLNKRFGTGYGLKIKVQLFFLGLFRLSMDSGILLRLKSFLRSELGQYLYRNFKK